MKICFKMIIKSIIGLFDKNIKMMSSIWIFIYYFKIQINFITYYLLLKNFQSYVNVI